MSVNVRNTSVLSSRVKLKTFVRESRTNDEPSEKPERRELNFVGDDAKMAYDEIVKSDIDKTQSSVKNRKLSTEKIKSVAGGRDRDKTRESRKHDKVTANSILRAVEGGDMKYLEHNVMARNVNICDNYGWTPLMSAAFSGNYKIVDFLLKLGANPRCRDKSGFTAAGLASKKNYSGIVALLKEKQSDAVADIAANGNPRKDPEIRSGRSRFYCSVCKQSFRETTVEKHEASTLHIFNCKPKMPGPTYAIPKQNKGYQMLLNRGWREEGLGPDGRGLKYPVKTVLKRDRKGLGTRREDAPRVTHFDREDARAVETVRRRPTDRTLRKRDREKLLRGEARRERAIRRALS